MGTRDLIFDGEEEVNQAPYQNISLNPNGGVDVEGEWKFSGSYSISVPSDTINNAYSYTGSVYKPYTKKGQSRWKVSLDVYGGESGRITLKVLTKSASSLK
ncbi:hypothetical protein ACFVS2_20455 [Brevibacillus sp. NPDC058079]|uniref:hypothetical protein n=1 Tax=Brevibacillus sp. NPDC058079 TaxID=3346330 RepID=UPI0036E1A0DE